ncbi:MAG: polyketide cyclase [Caulobacteraceae bacterium]|nr:polyketide cyclase [Caulobacteraceae bacterium]
MLAFAVIIVLALAVIIGLALSKAKNFTIQRTMEIAAPAERIYAEIEDFHRWAGWSPWDNVDPAMQKTYSGAAKGVGAVYDWSSAQKKVGVGRMTITGAQPVERVNIDLEFHKPFAARNDIVFSLIPEGGVTRVSWAMHGSSPFMHRLMGVFMDMDAMVGKDFEHGLRNLRNVTEKA